MNEKTMRDQKQWKDQDERKKQWENERKNNGKSGTIEGSRWMKETMGKLTKNNERSETMEGSRWTKETMGKLTKKQWEIRNNGKIKMSKKKQ